MVQAVAVVREPGLIRLVLMRMAAQLLLGHAIGQSGSRLLTTVLYELKRRDAHRAIISLCLGGGNAVAMAIER